jgi:hypothetical protein
MSQKIPPALVAVYLILVLLSTIPIFTGDDPLDAIFLVVLTLPWSFSITPLVDAISPSLFDNVIIGVLIGLVGAAINAVLLYLISRWIVNRVKGEKND